MRVVRVILLCSIVLLQISLFSFQQTNPLPITYAQEDSRFPITIVDATGAEVTIESDTAIVSGSGDITEILVALGFRDKLVGIDTTSTSPPELLDEITEIGFGRRLALEPVVAVAPTVFICTQTCGPESVFEQLRELDIPVLIVPDNEDGGLDLPFQKVTMIASALGVEEAGIALNEKLAREIDWVQTALANVDEAPAVFHPYLRGRGLQLAAGSGTPGHFMIEGAGGHNTAVDAGVEGYAPLSAELIFAAYPEYLVLTEGNVEVSGGLDNILDEQGLRDTPAVIDNNIIVMDTQLLLGMSIRTGEALMILAHEFHPEMTWELDVTYPYTYTNNAGSTIILESEMPLYIADADLLELVWQLGFHAELWQVDTVLPENSLVMAPAGIAVPENASNLMILSEAPSLDEVAAALNVPGRGEALKARLENE